MFDAIALTLLATWPAGDFPAQLALDPGLRQLYVVNEGANTLTVLDLDHGAMLARIPMPGNPTDVAVNPNDARVYVTDWLARQVVVVDGRTRELVAPLPVGSMPLRIAVDQAMQRLFVVDGTAPGADRGELWTIDVRSGATSRLPLGALPMGVAVDPDSHEVLVTDARRGTLTLLDPTGQQVRWEAALGVAPHTVVPSRTLGRAYVVLGGASSLAILAWPPAAAR